MTAQVTDSDFVGRETSQTNWMQHLSLFIVFLTCGLLVFVVFSHYYPFYEGNTDKIGRIVVAGAFLALALLSRFTDRFREYWLIPFAFFTALSAISIDRYLGLSKYIYPALGMVERSPAGWAVDKLESSLSELTIIVRTESRTNFLILCQIMTYSNRNTWYAQARMHPKVDHSLAVVA